MSIEIREVQNKKDLKQFIKLHWKLYAGVKQFVPPIMEFELSTLSKDKNPAFKISECKLWIAYKNGTASGRIAGIIHGEESKQEKKIRFGWADFIDDYDVSTALLDQVSNWGKSQSLDIIHGPLGFTDLDFQGALIEGFNQVSTQATTYNFPYYRDHFESYGMEKVVDWTETRFIVPDDIGEKLERAGALVQERYGLSIKTFKSGKEILKYAHQVFEVLNESYAHLYGYYPLNEKQIAYYIDSYFGLIKKDLVAMVVDKNDQVVGFAITFPSLSNAFKKAKGHLYPFGFIHVLKAFFFNDTVDFFLVAATKRGAQALLWKSLYKGLQKHKIKYLFSGQMLEDNTNVNNLWASYESAKDEDIRRRCFTKKLI